ncbi:aminoacyl-tRNA hydrolase [Chloroflexota bacterium]
MKLIVGLGNPGRGYAHNRHNIGFMCLSHFARKQGIRFDRKRGIARIGVGEVMGEGVILAKPQTFMNLSGQSVSQLLRGFEIALSDLLVVYDDLDLPLGKIRLRRGGGSGGHKGVDSIISSLRSQNFLRLRVGIGRPTSDGNQGEGAENVVSYVLSDFTPAEKQTITQAIPRVSEAMLYLLVEGLLPAMDMYN